MNTPYGLTGEILKSSEEKIRAMLTQKVFGTNNTSLTVLISKTFCNYQLNVILFDSCPYMLGIWVLLIGWYPLVELVFCMPLIYSFIEISSVSEQTSISVRKWYNYKDPLQNTAVTTLQADEDWRKESCHSLYIDKLVLHLI